MRVLESPSCTLSKSFIHFFDQIRDLDDGPSLSFAITNIGPEAIRWLDGISG